METLSCKQINFKCYFSRQSSFFLCYFFVCPYFEFNPLWSSRPHPLEFPVTVITEGLDTFAYV